MCAGEVSSISSIISNSCTVCSLNRRDVGGMTIGVAKGGEERSPEFTKEDSTSPTSLPRRATHTQCYTQHRQF